MKKLRPEHIPFPVSFTVPVTDGVYGELHPDGSVAALYHYRDGKCLREAHFAQDYLSGHSTRTDYFAFSDQGYMDGWQDFDGGPNPMSAPAYFDHASQEQQAQELTYQEFVLWAQKILREFQEAVEGLAQFIITCSFCGKTDKEVKKIIAGPNSCICNECVQLCTDIIAVGAGENAP